MGGLARPAYELISYPKDIQNSIKYVFSNFMICSTSEIAQKIAYNPNRQLSCKCVTYDGDVYEQGTLSGGYMNMKNMILPVYGDYQEIQAKINKEKGAFDQKRQVYEEYQRKMNEFRSKQKDLEAKTIRRDKIKNKLMNMELNIKKRDFNAEIDDIQGKIKELQKEKEIRSNKVAQLRSSLKNRNVKSVKQQRQEL